VSVRVLDGTGHGQASDDGGVDRAKRATAWRRPPPSLPRSPRWASHREALLRVAPYGEASSTTRFALGLAPVAFFVHVEQWNRLLRPR